MLKANEFDLKLAATQLQTRSVKFINAKIYALSVTNAHSIFARISYINFFASRVMAQVVKKIEIRDTGDRMKTERGRAKGSFIKHVDYKTGAENLSSP